MIPFKSWIRSVELFYQRKASISVIIVLFQYRLMGLKTQLEVYSNLFENQNEFTNYEQKSVFANYAYSND